jgi:hypothetical protein
VRVGLANAPRLFHKKKNDVFFPHLAFAKMFWDEQSLRPHSVIVMSQERAKNKSRAYLVASLCLILAGVLLTFIALASSQESKKYAGTSTLENVFVPFDDSQEIRKPTQKDVEPFAESAVKVLTEMNFWSHVENSDLQEACGLSQFPCVDQIGRCILDNMVKTSEGKMTPKTQACSCLAEGFQKVIQPPGISDVSISCSFHCVEAIFKIAQFHTSEINGQLGPTLQCKSILDHMAHVEFGNRNGFIADDGNLDSMEVVSVKDPKLAISADAVRVFINKERRQSCPMLPVYTESANVVYAKQGLVTEGREEFRMEVLLGDDVFFTRISHLPRADQLVNPVDAARY